MLAKTCSLILVEAKVFLGLMKFFLLEDICDNFSTDYQSVCNFGIPLAPQGPTPGYKVGSMVGKFHEVKIKAANDQGLSQFKIIYIIVIINWQKNEKQSTFVYVSSQFIAYGHETGFSLTKIARKRKRAMSIPTDKPTTDVEMSAVDRSGQFFFKNFLEIAVLQKFNSS
ncbi:hypothetical protein CEXT_153861 [Caerostris extrusa]|uniref:Uncharacterized protein n=1 Tax=Caerostris extrusa TaxID=172846 RepID=A0AAV4UXJ6_CAEEX|nr:hypothetical protein CEXT_153861 [Caerostris extrusa]